MSSDWKDFDPATPCIKCGDTGPAKTEYREKHKYPAGGVEPERLLRTCSRCGYAWIERCIDGSSNCFCGFTSNPNCPAHSRV